MIKNIWWKEMFCFCFLYKVKLRFFVCFIYSYLVWHQSCFVGLQTSRLYIVSPRSKTPSHHRCSKFCRCEQTNRPELIIDKKVWWVIENKIYRKKKQKGEIEKEKVGDDNRQIREGDKKKKECEWKRSSNTYFWKWVCVSVCLFVSKLLLNYWTEWHEIL